MEPMNGQVMRLPHSELEYHQNLVHRWRGKLFTGVGYDDTSPSGLSEVTFHNGAQEGPARDWYPSGVLKGESFFRESVQHGVAKEYSEDGEVASEAVYEYGILLSKSERGDDGELREVYVLAAESPNRRLLERFRRERCGLRSVNSLGNWQVAVSFRSRLEDVRVPAEEQLEVARSRPSAC